MMLEFTSHGDKVSINPDQISAVNVLKIYVEDTPIKSWVFLNSGKGYEIDQEYDEVMRMIREVYGE